MNITIKITHSNGTVMDISIPVVMPETTPSAVVTPDEPQVASETGNPVAGGLVDTFCPNGVEASIPYIAVAESERFLRKFGSKALAHDTTGEKRVGEDGEGDGRIGGMGERQDAGGEGEGGEENRVLVFKAQDGDYVLPPALHGDFKAAFGADIVDRELTKARLWCETNPQNRKTRRGMGRFLNAWLCRAQGERRVPISKRTGSLLEATNTSQQGW
jgi:hypothetical protein